MELGTYFENKKNQGINKYDLNFLIERLHRDINDSGANNNRINGIHYTNLERTKICNPKKLLLSNMSNNFYSTFFTNSSIFNFEDFDKNNCTFNMLNYLDAWIDVLSKIKYNPEVLGKSFNVKSINSSINGEKTDTIGYIKIIMNMLSSKTPTKEDVYTENSTYKKYTGILDIYGYSKNINYNRLKDILTKIPFEFGYYREGIVSGYNFSLVNFEGILDSKIIYAFTIDLEDYYLFEKSSILYHLTEDEELRKAKNSLVTFHVDNYALSKNNLKRKFKDLFKNWLKEIEEAGVNIEYHDNLEEELFYSNKAKSFSSIEEINEYVLNLYKETFLLEEPIEETKPKGKRKTATFEVDESFLEDMGSAVLSTNTTDITLSTGSFSYIAHTPSYTPDMISLTEENSNSGG